MRRYGGKTASLRLWDILLAYGYTAPTLVVMAVFMGIPAISAITLSLQQKTVGAPATFVGWQNFWELLHDSVFQKTVLNTFIFTTTSIILKIIIGMALALLLNGKIVFRNFWRAALLIPWVVPVIVTCVAWRWLFHDFAGVINYFLEGLHLISMPIPWLGLPTWAMAAVVVTITWRDYPFFAISFLAGLQTIPQEMYEAARIDGASSWQVFWRVTVPMLAPVTSTVLMTNFILTINDFQIVHIMTNGGPFFSTEIFATLMYRIAFLSGEIGKGAAVAVIQFPLLIALIVVVSRHLLKREI
jgi:multiple sugar transport system permease protein